MWTRNAAADGALRAVVLNSGGANACTGAAGAADTTMTAELWPEELWVADPGDVAVCSTGLIGVRLPIGHLLEGATRAAEALATSGGLDAAQAIMTTDTSPEGVGGIQG